MPKRYDFAHGEYNVDVRPTPEVGGVTLSSQIRSVVEEFNISTCRNTQICLGLLEEPLIRMKLLKFDLDPWLQLAKNLSFPTIIVYFGFQKRPKVFNGAQLGAVR